MINHQNLFGILEALLKILQHMNKHNFKLDYMNEILEDFISTVFSLGSKQLGLLVHCNNDVVYYKY